MAAGKKIVLTPRQEAWLVRHFRNTKNVELADHLGISESALHRFARALGLKKTKQFMRKCQAATTAAAHASHLRNGTYPPKGYRIPRSEEFQFKPGETSLDRLGKRKEKRRLAKAQASRRAKIAEDRLRVKWGLEQLTRVKLNPQPREAIFQRYYLRKHGYHVERGSMTVYYDGTTQRCPKMEKRKMGDQHFIAFKYVNKDAKAEPADIVYSCTGLIGRL